MKAERVYALVFASVYPHYVRKAETKGRTREDLDLGYSLADRIDLLRPPRPFAN